MHTDVLLIDGNPIFQHGLQQLLQAHNWTVATAHHSAAGLRLAAQLTPQIILLDINISGSNGGGLALLTQLLAQQVATKIALLDWYTNDRQLDRLLQAGAHGYLARHIQPDELLAALKDILRGKVVVPPELAPRLNRFQQQQSEPPGQNTAADLIATLTPREYETLTYLTQGLNNKLIAREMGLTEGTVKIHVKAILSKLKAETRINAAVIALEQGIGADLA